MFERSSDLASPALRSGEVRALSAKFAEGYTRIREVTDLEGALPAWLKALCMAGAAANKGQRVVVERELGRAASLGLASEHAHGAAMALLISRGEAVYQMFAEAVTATFGRASGSARADEPSFDVSVASARDYFQRALGSVPPYVEALASASPRTLEGYFLMREAALSENPLPTKLVELFYIPVNAVDLQPRLVGLHAASARQAGATEAEIVEAAVCAIPIAGLPCWVIAAEAIVPEGA